MSNVTNVVVHIEYAPGEVHKALELEYVKIPWNMCGGEKVMETDLYTAAFNYRLAEQLVEWFASLPWDWVSEATMSIYEQEGECTILRQAGNQTLRVET